MKNILYTEKDGVPIYAPIIENIETVTLALSQPNANGVEYVIFVR